MTLPPVCGKFHENDFLKSFPHENLPLFGHISYKYKEEVIGQYFSKMAKVCILKLWLMSTKYKEEVLTGTFPENK